jgi:Flp pilus assembly pilin Flp
MKKFCKNEEGAALVEYAVLLGIILAVGVAIFGSIGTSANTIFTNLNVLMGSAAQ